ncbi:MAG: hypothetical protein M0C28_40490 [Candidatus Moduliflexus flocculans]|nr:hypothetical protein [Candidatus Moduliflexus flocculans]
MARFKPLARGAQGRHDRAPVEGRRHRRGLAASWPGYSGDKAGAAAPAEKKP